MHGVDTTQIGNDWKYLYIWWSPRETIVSVQPGPIKAADG